MNASDLQKDLAEVENKIKALEVKLAGANGMDWAIVNPVKVQLQALKDERAMIVNMLEDGDF